MESISLQLDDLYVGQTTTHTVLVTEESIRSFAALTGDFHPLHTDKAYAVRHGFQDIIAHGVLLTSFSSKVIGMDLPGLRSILLAQNAEYLKPAFPDDVLTFVGTLSKIRRSLGIVTVDVQVSNQRNELVSRLEFTVKLRGT
jgi:3-hydroxybutyryl-CoA dehydratase